MHLPILPESRPYLSDLIKSAGPSRFGWHAVSLGMRCDRLAYYSLVKKLRSKTPSEALDFGVLIHACLEQHYKTGGRDTYKPILEIKDTLPEMALKAETLIDAYVKRYGREEASTWDIRGVEAEHECFIKAGRLGKLLYTCRYDLIMALKQPGEPPEPYGPINSGCTIVESKTTSALSRDLIESFGFDPQLLSQNFIWRKGGLDKIYGPLNGFIINIMVKTKIPQFERLEIKLEDRDVDRFEGILTANLKRIYSKLKRDSNDENLWPLNLSACRQRFGSCQFIDLCSSHGSLLDMYSLIPERPRL